MLTDFKNVGKHYAVRNHQKMMEVLMDPAGKGPVNHYYMIRGGKDQKNITVWEPGTISGEYIKTYGHYHVGILDETYWILFGEGIALLQEVRTGTDGNMIADEVNEFRAVRVKSGDSVYMPPGFGHLLVNTGSTYFVTADDSPVNFGDQDPSGMPGHADYEMVKKMQGFAFYVVEKDGKPVLVKNKKYKSVLKTDFGGLTVVE